MKLIARAILVGVLVGPISACTEFQSFGFMETSRNIDLPKGPAIEDVVTPFDSALSCIRGKIEPSISFAVGQVIDATGKESYAEGGSGKMLSQGAGEMVQTALFRSGVTVVNRRDPNISVVETQWGIRDIKQQTPTNFYISGSINSLDFIPGGGIEADIAGLGAGYRQSRILIALDLSLTDAFSGRIVANVPLQKQIFTAEKRFGGDKFFDTTLISLAAGGMEREAVHFAMRQMLNFATLELLGQLMSDASYLPCKAMVAPVDGIGSEQDRREDLSGVLRDAAKRNEEQPMQAIPVAQAEPNAAAPKVKVQMTPALRKQMDLATQFAGRALVTAQAANKAKTINEARSYGKESLQFLAVAMQALKTAAGLGLSGPEGDAVALLVEQAIKEVQIAQQSVLRREATDKPSNSANETTLPSESSSTHGLKDSSRAPKGSLEENRRPSMPN